ncbi:MAG: asparaginase [Propionibacteriaceae bacterium]|nr:asparaginase [Propionibacteriaceae bacterium]
MAGRYAGGALVAEVVRSGFVEGCHRGSVAVLDSTGSLVAAVGDPQGAIFPRSSNKLMQATAMLRAGFTPSDEAELALAAASHHGEPMHTERVTAMLARAGLTPEALICPADLPIDPEARRRASSPSRVSMNCSGKHTGMLLSCLAAGWPIDGYAEPSHPLQQAVQREIERLSGEAIAATGVDGCGAPVLAISLTGLARAFWNAVSAPQGTPERRVADAMRAHPELVSGTGAADARLMRATPGLLSKSGAEGVAAVAVPGFGAVALKVDDGAERARLPVVVEALAYLGLHGEELAAAGETPLLGGGRPVGAVRARAAIGPVTG